MLPGGRLCRTEGTVGKEAGRQGPLGQEVSEAGVHDGGREGKRRDGRCGRGHRGSCLEGHADNFGCRWETTEVGF